MIRIQHLQFAKKENLERYAKWLGLEVLASPKNISSEDEELVPWDKDRLIKEIMKQKEKAKFSDSA